MTYDEEINAQTSTDNEEIQSRGGGVRTVILCIVSTLLFILWAYSAYAQLNDIDQPVLWVLFYTCNAFIAVTFVVAKGFCGVNGLNVVKSLSILCIVMVIWAIGLTIASSIDVANAPKGDETQGGDSEFANYREEQVLKLSGALLCCASAVYHLAILKYCM